MKIRDALKITKPLAEQLAQASIHRRLLFVCPVGPVLRGVYLDSSRFDSNEFYGQVIVQPLFVPSPTLFFNLGWRLGNGASWHAESPESLTAFRALVRDVWPLLLRIRTIDDLVNYLEDVRRLEADDIWRRAYGCALLLQGRREEGVLWLRAIMQELDRSIPSDAEIGEQLERLIDGPPEPVLKAWSEQTERALQLACT